MNIRENSFNFLNNKIYLNANIAKFDISKDASCTFCTAKKYLPAPKENYEHFFGHCPITTQIIDDYFLDFCTHTGIAWDNKFVFIGSPIDNQTSQARATVLNIEILTVLHFILHCKKKGKLPLIRNVKTQIEALRELYLKSGTYRTAWSIFKNPARFPD